MDTKQYVTSEPWSKDAWVCLCGNNTFSDGFFPCDNKGNEVEPAIGSKWQWTYVCACCGNIIDQNTLEIIGRNEHFLLLTV